MNEQEVPVGSLVASIVTVLAASLVLSLAGLVLVGVTGGDPAIAATLTHVVETILGVFIGIAAGRLASPASEPGADR